MTKEGAGAGLVGVDPPHAANGKRTASRAALRNGRMRRFYAGWSVNAFDAQVV